MQSKTFSISSCIIILVISIWVIDGAAGESSMAPPSSTRDCSILNLNMVNCLSYLGDSEGKVEQPETDCCDGLEVVLKTDSHCVCQVFETASDIGMLSVTKAMSLPTVCNITTSPLNQCFLSTPSNGAVLVTEPPKSDGLALTSSHQTTSMLSSFSMLAGVLVLGFVATGF